MLLTADIVKQFDGGPRVEASIRISDGSSITILFGPSGAGKTTVLRCIAGLENLTSGRIIVDGDDWTKLPPYRRPVGYLFQDYALFPHLRVRDNIGYAAKHSPGGRSPRKPDAERKRDSAQPQDAERKRDSAQPQ